MNIEIDISKDNDVLNYLIEEAFKHGYDLKKAFKSIPSPILGMLYKYCKQDAWIYAKAFFDGDFNQNQIRFILKEANLERDIHFLMNPQFSLKSMEQIQLGVVDELAVEKYANPEYTSCQMTAIRKYLTMDIDLTESLSPIWSAQKMHQIGEAMLEGISLLDYINEEYSLAQIQEVFLGLKDNLDVSSYAHLSFSPELMKQYRLWLKQDIPYPIELLNGLSHEKIAWIRYGFELNIDIEKVIQNL